MDEESKGKLGKVTTALLALKMKRYIEIIIIKIKTHMSFKKNYWIFTEFVKYVKNRKNIFFLDYSRVRGNSIGVWIRCKLRSGIGAQVNVFSRRWWKWITGTKDIDFRELDILMLLYTKLHCKYQSKNVFLDVVIYEISL